MPDFFGFAAIATKMMLYFGVLTSTGLVISALLFAAPLDAIKKDVRKYAIAFGALGYLASIVSFSLRGAALTGDASGMTDSDILGILLETQVGTVFYLRMAGMAAMLIGLLIGGKGYWLSLAGGLVTIWCFAEIGHVPGLEGFWLQLLLAAHLTVAAFWIGVFIPLRKLALNSTQYSQAAELGHGFGRVASIAVPVLLVAGVVLSWKLVGSVQALYSTGYGIALMAKVGVVTALLGLAAANKLRFVPALQNGRPDAGHSLARAIRFEWVCVFGIFLATATFTSILSVPT
ncbi:MAG: copper resistance D family protein [Hyphomicrobiales bacterium]